MSESLVAAPLNNNDCQNRPYFISPWGYFAAWYSFSGLRADDRMLSNVILRELYLNMIVYPII